MQYSFPQLTERPVTPPQRVHGFMYLFEACDIVGKRQFGADWTMRELLARAPNRLGSEIPEPVRIEIPKNATEAHLMGMLASPGMVAWVLGGPAGPKKFGTKAEALAEWRQLNDKITPLLNAEREARKRFETVVELIIAELAREPDAVAWDRDTGDRKQVPLEFWLSKNGPLAFELQDDADLWADPNYIVSPAPAPYQYNIVGNVIVSRTKWSESVPSESLNPAPSKRHRGGRPQEYEWEQMEGEFLRFIAMNDFPPTQAELVKHLLGWFELRYNKQPAESMVKERVSRWYALHDSALEFESQRSKTRAV